MASLYQIKTELFDIFNQIEANDGEISEEQYNVLVIKQEELKDKVDAYVKAIKEWQKDEDFCKQEKKHINDRQNVYKNRIARLKDAIYDAVIKFGEQGKTNKYIEYPTYKIYTKTSKSVEIDEQRINILIDALNKFIVEVVKGGVLYTGEDVDLQGILDVINANAIAEYGENFIPFNLSDLTCCKVKISTEANIYDLFKCHKDALTEYGNNPITNKLEDVTSKDDIKTNIEVANYSDVPIPTIGKIISNNSIVIK